MMTFSPQESVLARTCAVQSVYLSDIPETLLKQFLYADDIALTKQIHFLSVKQALKQTSKG
jgi:hypothetical protein